MIFQIHPVHGRHIAYSKLEADTNLKNGWKTVTEEIFYAEKVVSSEPSQETKESAPKKRGRKPKINGNFA